MAKQNQEENISSQTNQIELGLYQNSMKKKINMLGNFFSILLILLGLFFLVNGLFGIVNKDGTNNNQSPAITDNTQLVNNTSFDKTMKVADTTGNIDQGISTYKVRAETSSAILKASETKAQIERTHRWKATNYEKGDIGIGEYEVKLGDTLWEIADAVYGSGSQWIKILDANRSSIGFLPNSSQALIVPGQILVLNK